MIRKDMVPMILIIGTMIVINFIDGSFGSFNDWAYRQLLMLPGIIIGLSFHEFAHGYVSYKCGDPTPRYQGRLTVNPAAHIDVIGFMCLLFAGFGWGKPVQIDSRYYKHPRLFEFLVSIAGVTMNLIIAIICAFILKGMIAGGISENSLILQILTEIIKYTMMINLVLMVFNLIPVPPLDGFGILTQIFNLRKYNWYDTVYRNGFFFLLFLVFFNVIGKILNPSISFLLDIMYKIII